MNLVQLLKWRASPLFEEIFEALIYADEMLLGFVEIKREYSRDQRGRVGAIGNQGGSSWRDCLRKFSCYPDLLRRL